MFTTIKVAIRRCTLNTCLPRRGQSRCSYRTGFHCTLHRFTYNTIGCFVPSFSSVLTWRTIFCGQGLDLSTPRLGVFQGILKTWTRLAVLTPARVRASCPTLCTPAKRPGFGSRQPRGEGRVSVLVRVNTCCQNTAPSTSRFLSRLRLDGGTH